MASLFSAQVIVLAAPCESPCLGSNQGRHEHNGADLYFQRPEEEYCSLTMAHGAHAVSSPVSTRRGSELNFASHAVPFWSFSAASTPAAARQMRIDMLT